MSLPIHVDVCSGLGAFGIAAAHAGYKTAAFCEIEPYLRRVIARHFPGAYIHDDLRTFTGDTLRSLGIYVVHLFTGGFPCQDICSAGGRAGLDGERSGLWYEQLRLIREIQPRFVVIENVPDLRTCGIDIVLAGLEAAGYAAEALVVGAWAAGASQERERVWIVAHSRSFSDAQAGSPLDTFRSTGGARHYDGWNGGSSSPRTDRAVSQSRMGGIYDGSAAGLDRLRWPAAPGASVGEWEPALAGPKTAHHDERMKACGNAIVWPVAAAIFHGMREAMEKH